MGIVFQATSCLWLALIILWGPKENHECDCVYVRMVMYVHCKYYSSRGKGFLTCQKVRLYFKVLQLTLGEYPNLLGSPDIHTSVIAIEVKVSKLLRNSGYTYSSEGITWLPTVKRKKGSGMRWSPTT